MNDGHLNKCKECCKVHANKRRNDKIEEIREYDRNRPNKKERNEINKARSYLYVKKKKEYIKQYRKKNPEKAKAHNAVSKAVMLNKLLKKPCEICGSKKVHAHHADYSKPLDVRWLCPIHHSEQHKKEKESL